ncbi:SOS response-associated peptidase [Alteribacter natronophilus]|uniref:SOS response-associated peptidase n=1 Tax=Alteribacter natronophilus TaxID=2583810 RepID=UPI00110D3B0A|nr:SOS response-associated peptidase [Alteribacter natronophilus]TMW73492.1 SOS response-associated peptidase [Alteribacter natronophilus]
MCGRFAMIAEPSFIEEALDPENPEVLKDVDLRYNVAPGSSILTAVQGHSKIRAGFMKWGLVPFWAKDTSIGYKMINARSETADEKPSFRNLMRKRRCLIPVSGFYEWKKENGRKQPYYIHPSSEDLFVFAGLWDRWEKNGQTLHTCTILTTGANSLMEAVHHRMPVILGREGRERWINPSVTEPDDLKDLLIPCTSNQMHMHRVSTVVNNAANEGPECIVKADG